MVSVFLAGTDIGDSEYKRIYDRLPASRKSIVDKRRNEKTKKETALAFFLLMHALRQKSIIRTYGELETWEYSLGEHGKPYFRNKPQLFFSISHTAGKVMCALADDEVGCDIEFINKNREKTEKIYRRFFAADETEKLDKLEDEQCVREFYRIWTEKESFVKMIGTGMTDDFGGFSVFECKPLPVVVFEDGKHTASICCSDIHYSVEEINWKHIMEME